MDDIILEVLQSVYTPERMDSILLLVDTIHDAGDRLFVETVSHLVGQVDQHEPLDLSDKVVEHLRGVAIGFLNDLEIHVSDEIPLDTLSALVQVFHSFDSSEDNEDILNILEVESDPKEALMGIIMLRSALTVEDLFEFLYDPSDAQMSNIHDLVSGWIQLDPEDTTDYEELDLVQVARELPGATDLPNLNQVIADGMPTGVGIEAMLNNYGDSLTGLSLESLVPELTGLHILAGNTPKDIVEEVLESARCYTLDDDLQWEQNVRRLTVETLGDLKW